MTHLRSFSLAASFIVAIAACGQSGTGATSAGPASSATSSESASSAGSGGMTSSSASSASTTGSGGAAGGAGGAGGGSGGGTSGGHLLISEVGVQPAGGEFVEIYNPSAAAVDLSSYYISDNSAYYGIAMGTPWNPMTNNPGTDFLAQFPAGTMLAPGAAIVIATDATFEAQYMKCPDFILDTVPLMCTNGMAKALVAPMNGGIGDKKGAMLSNDREMVVLFQWDGAAKIVKDVDYVTWGTMFDAATRVDKTAVMGYQPDTAPAMQKGATPPGTFQSIERCSTAEPGEKAAGGNGISGHDETSEPFDTNFTVQMTPTPGTKNACL